MTKTQKHYLRLIRGLDDVDPKGLLDILSVPYNEDLRYGFAHTETLAQSISSTLVYQIISRQRVFDPLSGALSTEERPVFEYVSFQIDYHAGLMLAQRGGRKLAKLISILQEISDSRITVSDFPIDIPLLIHQIDRSDWSYLIKSVSVRSFRPVVGLTGVFDATVSEQGAAHALIQLYKTDITNVCFDLTIDDSVANLLFTNSGVFILRTEDDSLEAWIAHTISIALRCQYA